MVGFVYRIYDENAHRWYIGKKTFYNQVTRPPLKGKTRKRRSKVESDWQNYFGSNAELTAEVNRLGVHHFHREVWHLCRSKSEMTYLETKEIFAHDAVISDRYYNGWVAAKVSRNQLPHLVAASNSFEFGL